jgi:hypothetical protein
MRATFATENGRTCCLFWQQRCRQSDSPCNSSTEAHNGIAMVLFVEITPLRMSIPTALEPKIRRALTETFSQEVKERRKKRTV